MGKAVTVSNYHHDRARSYVQRGIRKSIATVVEEALSSFFPRLEREADEWEDFQHLKKEEKETLE